MAAGPGNALNRRRVVPGPGAPNVTGMVWKLLGLLLGAAVAAGPLESGRRPAARVSEALFTAGSDLLDAAFNLASIDPASTLRQVSTLVVGVCIPGITALALVAATNLADDARRVASFVLVGGAVLLVFTYGQTAVPAAGLLVAASLLLGVATGLLLVVPVTALATIITAAHARLLLADDAGSPVGAASVRLAELAGAGDPSMWRLALLATALVPFAYVARNLLRL